jgi:hypothetical protein
VKILEEKLHNMTRINEKIQNLFKLWDILKDEGSYYALSIYMNEGQEVIHCEERNVRYAPDYFTCLDRIQDKLFTWADCNIVEIRKRLLRPYKWMPLDFDMFHKQFIAASILTQHPSTSNVVVYRRSQPKETIYRIICKAGEIHLPFKGTEEWDDFVAAFVTKEREGLQKLYKDEVKEVLKE